MEPSLSDAVSRINRTVCQNVPSSKYVTFFLASLDPATGRLDYVNAGHNPPILVRAGGDVDKLTFGGLVLGIFEGVSYEGGNVVMEQGDTLIVYSDGVTETWDPDGEEFGEDKLVALTVADRAKGADAVQAGILREIESFEQGARATDDRTLVVLKREERA
jgi:sigma-B regulation protein RsbU (phosphoserine phosphatase)